MIDERGNRGEGRIRADQPPLTGFAHVTVEKARLYRAIMRRFMQAKTQFRLHLRPQQLASSLRTADASLSIDRVELERALQQLCDWGNLEKHLDTVEVATVAEFLRPRFLYQISEAGQAVERALRTYEEAMAETGELQTTALHEIRGELDKLLALAESPAIEGSDAWRCLDILRGRFERLTARAQTFLSSLQRTTQLQGVDLKGFLTYKQLLIDYLQRFVAELTVSGAVIAEKLERIEAAGIEPVLTAAARHELRDAIPPAGDAEHTVAADQWRARWDGLRSWFIGARGQRSQAEELRRQATAAIPALLRAVVMLHDRRVARSDRVADLQTLARWFAQTDDDRQAHRLWRAAFGLAPARHLRVDQDTLERWDQAATSARTRWEDAPPVQVSPRLRKTGRTTRKGPPGTVIDRRREKAALARFAAEQARQIAAARAVLATGQATRLSQLKVLDGPAFELFLDLLGEALAWRRSAHEAVEAASADGTLLVRMEPTGDGVMATVRTEGGRFHGEDHHILIRETQPSPPLAMDMKRGRT